jgi:hypothetical protein
MTVKAMQFNFIIDGVSDRVKNFTDGINVPTMTHAHMCNTSETAHNEGLCVANRRVAVAKI